MTVKEMEKEIASIKRHLTKLEKQEPRQKGQARTRARKTSSRRALLSDPTALTEREKQERALKVLRAKRMLSEPTEREKQMAAEWMVRPEAERTRLTEEFRASAPNVSLSDIVIANRR